MAISIPTLRVLAWAMLCGCGLQWNAAAAEAACPQVGFTIVEPHASPATRPVSVGRNQTIFVHRVPITTTRDLVAIKLVSDEDDNQGASLLLKFTPAADQRLHDATNHHAGRRIAFMFNDEVLINVVWQGPYGFDPGGVRVSIRHGMKPAQQVMKALRGCIGPTAGGGHPQGAESGAR